MHLNQRMVNKKLLAITKLQVVLENHWLAHHFGQNYILLQQYAFIPKNGQNVILLHQLISTSICPELTIGDPNSSKICLVGVLPHRLSTLGGFWLTFCRSIETPKSALYQLSYSPGYWDIPFELLLTIPRALYHQLYSCKLQQYVLIFIPRVLGHLPLILDPHHCPLLLLESK